MKIFLLFWTLGFCKGAGILYPRSSETREVLSLDGIWNFVLAPDNDPYFGHLQYWYKNDLSKMGLDIQLMPVPSSYNDISLNSSVRDHVGVVWYDRHFFVPKSWSGKRVWLRFSSVHYKAEVWVNGESAVSHEMGHLPFQNEITMLVHFGRKNRITVACENILQQDTVPQGKVYEFVTKEGKKQVQSYTFDFFNYAGIHRPVVLYTTPKSYISDVTVTTNIAGKTGTVYYNVSFVTTEDLLCVAVLKDKEGNIVKGEFSYGSGVLVIPNAKFWWPYLMHVHPGYLYTLQIELRSPHALIDMYRQPVGIRTISWTNSSLFINGKKVYLQGFGRHEDSDIRGKGLDMVTVVKDHNLLKWVGANTYRTSHYPYAEEIMDMADQMGFMIIDECPSADTTAFSYRLLQKHKDSLRELIQRDKNRPSVIMWSLANEPTTDTFIAGHYFSEVVNFVKSVDKSRPLTVAISKDVTRDQIGGYLDIISFNRYNSWYSNSGQLDTIINRVVKEASAWHQRYNKPVIMSEYGADTLEGLHIHPAYVWSEEFQVSMMSKHFQAFDSLRSMGWFIGEYLWNFADFKTAQTTTRVGGNKKGIFTRDRQPKAGAHYLRKRYFQLAHQLYNASLPRDFNEYIADVHDEL